MTYNEEKIRGGVKASNIRLLSCKINQDILSLSLMVYTNGRFRKRRLCTEGLEVNRDESFGPENSLPANPGNDFDTGHGAGC